MRGLVLNEADSDQLINTHWVNGKMSTALLAQDIDVILERTGLSDKARPNTRFLIVPTTEAGEGLPISGEKMSRFLSLYVAENFEEAVSLAIKIQDYQGAGHSLGLHSKDDAKAHHLAMAARTCRVIVNQAHCFATGGFFDNGMPFSLSMGCGSWGAIPSLRKSQLGTFRQ